jgi:hypothetical protein
MSKALVPSSSDSPPSGTLTIGAATAGVPAQSELTLPQGALAPPGPSRLRAFLAGVVCGFLLASLSLALLLVDTRHSLPTTCKVTQSL